MVNVIRDYSYHDSYTMTLTLNVMSFNITYMSWSIQLLLLKYGGKPVQIKPWESLPCVWTAMRQTLSQILEN